MRVILLPGLATTPTQLPGSMVKGVLKGTEEAVFLLTSQIFPPYWKIRAKTAIGVALEAKHLVVESQLSNEKCREFNSALNEPKMSLILCILRELWSFESSKVKNTAEYVSGRKRVKWKKLFFWKEP